MANNGRNIAEYNKTLSPEERAESARRAAYASIEARRKYRKQRDLARQILMARVPDKDLATRLRELGMDDTFGAAVVFAQASKATIGDTEAARYIRDTAGEKPTEQYNLSVSDKPIKSLDLSQMSDEELEALADSVDE